MKTPKKSIIFDMDGTLSDTAKATTVACNKIGQQFGTPNVNESDVRSVMGYADPEFFYRLYPGQPHELLNKIRYEVNELEDKMISKLGKSILFPGVEELLTDLSEKGYNLYIASTGSKYHVHTTLTAGGIEHLFTGIHCGEPVKIKMVSDIIEGHDKDKYLMVGDMHKDSEAAKANGVFVLGVAFGYLDLDDYPLFDAILKTPHDLYSFL